jgi:hypothetical protein
MADKGWEEEEGRIYFSSSKKMTFVNLTFVPNASFIPPPAPLYIENKINTIKESPLLGLHSPHHSRKLNLSKKLLDTISYLRQTNHLHIVNTDKNLGPAIMLTSDYVKFCLSHLRSPFYQRVHYIPMDNIRNAIRQLHNTIIEEFENEKKGAHILIHNLELTTPSYFHALPKIHKSPMGCSPIVSNVNAPTEGLSKWLTVELRNYVRSCSSFVKDSRTAQLQITALPVDSK